MNGLGTMTFFAGCQFSFLKRKIHALVFALLIAAAINCARAAEISFPLTVPFDFLTLTLSKQLYTAPEEVAPIWHESECRHLYLDHPQFGREGELLRFVSHGAGSVGTALLGGCFAPVSWHGFLEVMATPSITTDWRLLLRVERSSLYDDNWKKGLLTGPIWDAMQRFVLPALTDFSLNLAPPRDELLSLISVSLPSADAAQLETILRSATARSVRIDDQGIIVDLVLTVPDTGAGSRPPPVTPEAPLSVAELERVHVALQNWDAFLVFVIKGLGKDIVDPIVREQVVDLLLASRYQVLPILTGDIRKSESDPVRMLFRETWQRLQEIIRDAQQRGIELDKLTRYVTFLHAGDVLLAIDRAAPQLGMEISADGLRRLARILQPEAGEDPLIYSLEPDPVLRTLFGLPPELPVEPPSESVPEDIPLQSHFNPSYFVYTTQSQQMPAHDLRVLAKQLDRWVPKNSELFEYRPIMDRLLHLTTVQVLQNAVLEKRHESLFGHLVRATALIESCWRQFVHQRGKIIYQQSAAGSIGLMQINRHVWRGFYNLEQIKWNVTYNAEAGVEILLYYLRRYALREEKAGRKDSIARATYAAYNAGPGAVDRYRNKQASQRAKAVDNRFWKIYQGFSANGQADLSNCRVARHHSAEAM